jgi:MSHA biogenesis protein MshQ
MNLFSAIKIEAACARWLRVVAIFCIQFLGVGMTVCLTAQAQSSSYVNSSDTFSWIDSSSHNRIRAYSTTYDYPGNPQPPAIAFPRTAAPFFFYTPSGAACGTTGTIIDDRLTDEIPLGFTFKYAGVNFTSVRVNSNGRIQFNNNLTCGSGTDNGTPTIYTYDYPDAGMNYTMRIYGADLDSTPKNFSDGGVLTPVNASYATVCQDDAQCYVSYATIGTAPTRKFVVTWNNVPKWVNAGLIAGNFNLQIILEEGGDFVFQYGNVADSQANVPAQIGWQVNANDYDIKQTALPTNNSAIRYQVPRPLVQYQMEQASWSAAAGQVIDTSGNNNHGTRLGAAQTTVGGYACLGANIPSNTNVGTIDGINTGVNLQSTLGGVGTINFWYKPNAWVGTAAAVNGMLLDATTAADSWFYLSKLRVNNTTTKLRFAIRDDTGTTRSVETAAMSTSVLSASGWVFITVSWNFNSLTAANSDRLRIYVNGSAIGSGNSVQSAFTTSGAPAAGIGTLTIGDNRSTFVDGANSNGSSANGVIDEFRMYNIEAGYGQVLTDYTAAAGCSNHYAIAHAGSGASPVHGATCISNSVSVTMHTSSDIPIPTSSQITLSTSTGKGDWTLVSGYGILNNGTANDGTATYKFNNENQVVLALNHTTAGTVNINVTDGTIVEKPGAEDASLIIDLCSVAGFNGCEYKTARCDAAVVGYDRLITKLAGNTFTLDAVTLNASGVLDTTFNKNVTVDLLVNTSYVAPLPTTYCPASQTAVIGMGSVAFSNGRVSASGIPVTAAALAAVAPSYSTYGDIRMRFTCSAANCPPSGLTVCSRDAFAVRPADLVLTASAMTNTSVTTGTPRQVAGTQFAMTAQARTTTNANAAGYNGTPKIDYAAQPQSVSAQSVATPVTLTDYTDRLKDANVNNVALFNSASVTTGLANASFYYLDYGGFRVLGGGVRDAAYVNSSVDVPGTDCVANSSSNTPDANGLVGCLVANQSNSSLIGRFYPNSFYLTSSPSFPESAGYVQLAKLSNACAAGAFTYEGQPFAINNTFVYALSSGTVIAAAAMPRYTAGVVAIGAENNNGGVDLSARVALNQVPVPSWANGVYAINTVAATFSRAAAPDGPFDALDIGVSVTDATDGITLGGARNMLPTTNTACTAATCTHQRLTGAPVGVRYGRLRLQNAYGSERLNLPVPLEAQFWNGGAFVRNISDSCTTLVANNVSLVNRQAPVTAANVTVAGVGALVAGQGNILLSQPNPNTPWANIGNLDVILNLGGAVTSTCPTATPANPLGASVSAAMPFLASNGCGTATDTRNPTARASFGAYRSPLIFRRENY